MLRLYIAVCMSSTSSRRRSGCASGSSDDRMHAGNGSWGADGPWTATTANHTDNNRMSRAKYVDLPTDATLSDHSELPADIDLSANAALSADLPLSDYPELSANADLPTDADMSSNPTLSNHPDLPTDTNLPHNPKLPITSM